MYTNQRIRIHVLFIVHIRICIYLYVCMFVCMCTRPNVRQKRCMHACRDTHKFVRMCIQSRHIYTHRDPLAKDLIQTS